MAYTVKQLAKLSNVSVRTLHWYDEIGLLKPAYHGANGYRYYEEEQLLMLQQILFFRELGFELKHIGRLLGRSDFDTCIALKSHKKRLQRNIEKTQQLIKTIDKTLKHLKGEQNVTEHELFSGFSKEQQAAYEEQLIARFGKQAKMHIAESKEKAKNWSEADQKNLKKEFDAICGGLASLIDQKKAFDTPEAQALICRHYEWLKHFWTPNQESYAAHGRFIADSELRQAYENYHAKLPEYIAQAIQVFADTRLN